MLNNDIARSSLSPAGVETRPSKQKFSQRGLMYSSVLFERTYAMRQGLSVPGGLLG
jgi:hypothetical protein